MNNLLFQRILLPVDFAPVSREAFLLGLRLAHQFQAQVFLLHVIDTKALDALNALGLALPSEEKAQKKTTPSPGQTLGKGVPGGASGQGIKDDPVTTGGETVYRNCTDGSRRKKIDLVVMGSYGGQTGDISHIFFGSTAEKIVRTVPCPVLTVPYPFNNLTKRADIKISQPAKKATKGKKAQVSS